MMCCLFDPNVACWRARAIAFNSARGQSNLARLSALLVVGPKDVGDIALWNMLIKMPLLIERQSSVSCRSSVRRRRCNRAVLGISHTNIAFFEGSYNAFAEIWIIVFDGKRVALWSGIMVRFPDRDNFDQLVCMSTIETSEGSAIMRNSVCVYIIFNLKMCICSRQFNTPIHKYTHTTAITCARRKSVRGKKNKLYSIPFKKSLQSEITISKYNKYYTRSRP